MEYGFGAHDYPTTGVFEVDPKSCPGFSYRRSILLGYTNMLPFEFREFIDNLASDYHGDSYHLILKNCNHFTQDASMKLTGKSIPKWVNRVAHLSKGSSLISTIFRILYISHLKFLDTRRRVVHYMAAKFSVL